MAFNPMLLGQIKNRMDMFNAGHPRFVAFLENIGSQGVQAGTIVELKVTDPDGRERITNLRLTEEDVETIRMAAQMKS